MDAVIKTGGKQYRVTEGQRLDVEKLGPVDTEVELMDHYGVSRATVRQALRELVAEGLLEIRRGLGTYVSRRRFEHTIGGFYSFSREIERHGLEPRAGTRFHRAAGTRGG